MSLKHILLGMLSEPQSGYDLKKHFDQSLKNFWSAELSQIYPQLKKMETSGLLKSHEEESASGPNRRVYTRSAKGRRELLSWLAEGPQVGEERISYLTQVFFLNELEDKNDALSFMQELRAYMVDRYDYLVEVDRFWRKEDPRYPDELPDADYFPQLTLALGLKRIKATIEWCDETIERMQVRLGD